MIERVSSADSDYVSGKLSVFPAELDTSYTLYEARNNAVSVLKQSVTYNGKFIVLEDGSNFPDFGILRLSSIGSDPRHAELVFYNKKRNNVFTELLRGFGGSRQSPWQNKETIVTNAVNADNHNSVKDAILNIQAKLGTKEFPADESLNGILTKLEQKYFAPRPMFAAYPKIGPPPLTVRFQNFSENHIIRNLWDFGDGSTSTERNPIHTFATEGIFTVQLNVITVLGAQGIAVKSNYITVSSEQTPAFFYVEQSSDPAYSSESSVDPTVFTFVDQTDGDIASRLWVFGDGEQATVNDPDIHTIQHIYDVPGTYSPSLLVFLSNSKVRRVLSNNIVVL